VLFLILLCVLIAVVLINSTKVVAKMMEKNWQDCLFNFMVFFSLLFCALIINVPWKTLTVSVIVKKGV
jgi:hypothetical protein